MDTLQQYLKDLFGFDKFKGYQQQVIEGILNGKNVLVIMPTGGGKSLCYQLPAMIMEGTAIVVSPLIALMKNQVDGMRMNIGKEGVAHVLNSSLTKAETQQVKDDLKAGTTKILYVAPETLSKAETIQLLREIKVSFFAVDEAHCISEWGHDFRPEYRRLMESMNAIDGSVGRMALTASATPKVREDIISSLNLEDAEVYIASFNRPNLYYEVRPKPKDELTLHKELIRFIKENSGKSGIIYCLMRKRVEELAELLVVNGIKAAPYHAGLDAKTRAENQDKFLMEEVDVIVATIAFGMGIDKSDVRYVIHYDIPKSVEGYYQETGRAGRDGGEGKCIAFYSEEDVERLYKFFSDKNITEQEQSAALVQEMVSYAESTACRRLNILKYFGEDYNEENCGNCDNCLHPKPKVEAHEEMQYALEVILAVKQDFKARHIIDVIMGKHTSEIEKYGHSKLDVFGEGTDHDENFWRAVLRQGVFEDLLQKEVKKYGVLKLTAAGRKYIRKPYDIYISPDHDYTQVGEDNGEEEMLATGGGNAAVGDEALYSQLRSLRKSIASREKLPVHVIFEDTSLKDMTLQYPCTLEELAHCTGVGQAKASRYGKPFIELIKAYVEENEIERPQDIVVKSVAKSSNLRIFIRDCIDGHKDLTDIAEAKRLTMDELITEMENIVSSGTKIDISYYIDEILDEEDRDFLMDYWRENYSNSFEEAFSELVYDGDYTEEEVRLIRLKFNCDFGF